MLLKVSFIVHILIQDTLPYRCAQLTRLPTASLSHPSPLQASRAYSIDISPHLLYCSSDIVSCLATSRLSEYLEFKALEHIVILNKDTNGEVTLNKVPSSRDDIFTSPLSLQEKRKLMKFLTFASSPQNTDDKSLEDLLSLPEYNLPPHLREIITYAIALSPTPDLPASTALAAINRHLRSVGIYGPFPLLVPMHGGGGEIAQAFCRSAAVKGATYILGREIENITHRTGEFPLRVEFRDVEEMQYVNAKKVVRKAVQEEGVEVWRRVVVVLEVGEFGDGVHKEAALVVVPPRTVSEEQEMPVQVIVHGGGIGECPIGQCISSLYDLRIGTLYSSTHQTGSKGLEQLEQAERFILEKVSGKTNLSMPILIQC